MADGAHPVSQSAAQPGDAPGWTDLLPCETADPAHTLALGRRLAAPLAALTDRRGSSVVALLGGLGAGKTHLVKGICAGLGIDPDRVTSPTFTLVHEYAGGRLPVAHIDAFRLQGPEDLLAIGVEDVLDRGVVLIEWPERMASLLPPDTVWLQIEVLDPLRRRIGRFEPEAGSTDPPAGP